MGLFDKLFNKKKPTPQPAQAQRAPSTPKPAQQKDTSGGTYQGRYKGALYAMTHDVAHDVFLIELQDFSGRLIPSESFSYMLGNVAVISFALTEAEFALKNSAPSGGENAAIDALLDRLLERLPKDRIIAALQFNPATREKQPLEVRPRCDTMDDNALAAGRTRKAIDFVRSLDCVWVMYNISTGVNMPTVDGQGYAFVYSSEASAEKNRAANVGIDLAYRRFDQNAFRDFVRTWYGLGVTRFRLNPGGDPPYAALNRDDFLPDERAKKWDYYGSSLNQLILRFRQNRAIANNAATQAAAATYWDSLCHQLPKTVLLVPFGYDGDAGDVSDRTLHLTAKAASLLNRIEIARQTGAPLKDDENVVVEREGQPVNIGRIDLFFGGEGYSFATETRGNGVMYPRTLIGADKSTALCAFTDIAAFNAAFNGTARIALFTFDELMERMNDTADGRPLDGFVLNAGTNPLFLNRNDLNTVNKLRNEPSKIYTPPKQA